MPCTGHDSQPELQGRLVLTFSRERPSGPGVDSEREGQGRAPGGPGRLGLALTLPWADRCHLRGSSQELYRLVAGPDSLGTSTRVPGQPREDPDGQVRLGRAKGSPR